MKKMTLGLLASLSLVSVCLVCGGCSTDETNAADRNPASADQPSESPVWNGSGNHFLRYAK